MTNAPSTFLVDTNVLVYAWDVSDPGKQSTAERLLVEFSETNRAVLSVQVLGEYFHTVTRKMPQPMPSEEAIERVEDFLESMPVRPLTVETVIEAMKAVGLYQMSYWDALIWATAKLNDIATVLTEDIQSSGTIEGVRFVNPFDPSFDFALLGS